MTAHGYPDQMMELDVTCCHNRPRESNDNPLAKASLKPKNTSLTIQVVLMTFTMLACGLRNT
jgi:hypothetical protein